MRLSNPRTWSAEQLADYRRAFVSFGENINLDTREGGAIVTYEKAGVFYAAAFWGKSAKSAWHYRFKTAEQRAKNIADFWLGIEASAKVRAERKESRKADLEKMSQQMQVGTILHGSWGYDQTNCELWEIVERRGLAVWVRPVCCETVPGTTGFMCEDVRPVPGKYCGEAVKKIIGPYGLSFDCFTLSPCDPAEKHYSSHYA